MFILQFPESVNTALCTAMGGFIAVIKDLKMGRWPWKVKTGQFKNLRNLNEWQRPVMEAESRPEW